jgi:hypothetical protein
MTAPRYIIERLEYQWRLAVERGDHVAAVLLWQRIQKAKAS